MCQTSGVFFWFFSSALTEESRAVIETFAENHGYYFSCNSKYYDVFCVTQDNLVNV